MGKDKEIIVPKQEEVRVENVERKFDNSHLRKKLQEDLDKGITESFHFPKYYMEEGYPIVPRSFKEVPGWINDAENVFTKMVEEAEDGDHFVEIGTLLGQSATHMAQQIKNSGKKIKFDSIDLFWLIPTVIEDWKINSHPHQFYAYYEMIKKTGPGNHGASIIDIVKNPLLQLGLVDYVNFITCDEKYAHKLYNDNQLKFVWIDGDHQPGSVYHNLINLWPKIKEGGVIGGDDLGEVKADVERFEEDLNKLVEAGYNIPPIEKVEYNSWHEKEDRMLNHFIIRKKKTNTESPSDDNSGDTTKDGFKRSIKNITTNNSE